MLSRDDIARSLTGAWELFLDRPSAMQHFDVSVDGFWRSFAAIVLIIPSYALTVISERQAMLSDALPDRGFDEPLYLFSKALALCLDWVALPIVLALIARPLQVGRSYSAFIVARNWGSVIAMVPFGAIAFLLVLDGIGLDAANYLSLAALIIVLRYNYIIARRALGAGIGLAIAIVVFDLLLSLSISLTVDGLFGI